MVRMSIKAQYIPQCLSIHIMCKYVINKTNIAYNIDENIISEKEKTYPLKRRILKQFTPFSLNECASIQSLDYLQ